MRIQFIHPPVYINVHAMTALRPSLPLGLASVAAVVREAGHQVSVLDAVGQAPGQVTPDGRLHYLGLTPDQIVGRVDPEAQVLGLTNTWSFSWPLVRRIAVLLKEKHPDKILVAGGEHFTGMPELSLETSPIDFIVLGEGEETILELLGALEAGRKDFSSIRGLAFREKGEVRRTPPRPRIEDVDSLPWPAWDLFDPKAYHDNGLVIGLDAGMTMPILATRGCPYACTYCSSSTMWTRRWYARNPVDVVDEIEHYHKKYGATNFPFQDLTAILKKDWVVTFCKELLKRNLEITWQFPSGTRCEVIDEEVADLLARTGGRSLAFAPESGSERTRKLIGKQMTEEALMKAVRASVGKGLNITCFFVIGFPHDTWADLRETFRMVRKLAVAGIDDVAVGFFFPIPGTRLYDELVEKGRIRPTDEFLYTPIFANDEKIRPENNYCENLSARRLTLAKYLILLNFYPLSFLTHPWRVFTILWNVFRGKETRKLETYLNDLKRKVRLWFRARGKARPGKAPLPEK